MSSCRATNAKGMWLALQTPDEHSKMSLPYIYMKTVGGGLVPWLASQTDMLAEDWGIDREARRAARRAARGANSPGR